MNALTGKPTRKPKCKKAGRPKGRPTRMIPEGRPHSKCRAYIAGKSTLSITWITPFD